MTTPFQIIAEYLQSIPPKVRQIVLLVYACVVVLVQVLLVLDVGLDFTKINTVLAILGGYLGFQSAANVPASGEGAHRDDVPVAPPIERGDGAA